MDKKILLGVIGEKLEIIQEQFSIIRDYEGKIPTIEVDLLMSNIRDLYDLFINLQQGNKVLSGDSPTKTEPSRKPEMPPPPVVVEVAGSESVFEETEPADIPEITISFKSPSILGFESAVGGQQSAVSSQQSAVSSQQSAVSSQQSAAGSQQLEEEERLEAVEPVATTKEEATASDSNIVSSQELEEEDRVEEVQPVATTQEEATASDSNLVGSRQSAVGSLEPEPRPVRTAFDLFSEGSHGTLADKYRDNQEKSVADRLSENKVLDLRTTIGINDKFLFINELFDGNMRIYDEAVKKLNDCTTMAQADMLLLDLKIVYNWDSEAPTVKKFVELVRKKF